MHPRSVPPPCSAKSTQPGGSGQYANGRTAAGPDPRQNLGVADEGRQPRDPQAVLAVIQRVSEAVDLDRFVGALLDGVVELVPSDLATYNEVTAETHFVSVARPADFVYPPDVYDRFAELRHEHPVLAHQARTGDGAALRISDLIDRDTYHRTGLYQELYRPMRVEHQLVFGLPAPRSVQVVVAISRAADDFTDDECRLVETIRPHLAAAYRHLRRAEILSRQLELLAGSAGGSTRTTVTLAADGGGLEATGEHGAGLLARWLAPGAALGQTLEDWLAADHAPPRAATLRVTGAAGTLVIRGSVDDDGRRSLVLEEQIVDAGALRHLGLTARQAEVLARVVEGGTNTSIASALGIRPATVKKLLEQIYATLGVHDRRSAIAAAVEVLPPRDAPEPQAEQGPATA